MSDLVSLFANPQTQWILLLIAADVILGVIAALLKKDFVLGKLAGFMKRGIIAYVLGYAVLNLASQALPKLSMIADVAFVLILLALVGSVLDNLGKLGLPVPKILRK